MISLKLESENCGEEIFITSIVIDNNFLSNSFILSLLLQNIMIAPTTYKIFGETYDNYKSYQP